VPRKVARSYGEIPAWSSSLISRAAGRTLPSSLGWVLGLPELGVQHYFSEIVVIQVRRGAEDRMRA